MVSSYDGNDVISLLETVLSGKCLNFFLSGASASSREKIGMQIATTIEEKELISLRGAKKKFTILMPFYDDVNGAERFLAHLRNSVSIAQDCYDAFKGVILIELDQEWGDRGYNDSVQSLFDYIRRNRDVCFIILFPTTGEDVQNREFYKEISSYGNWIRVVANSPTPRQCADLFESIVTGRGYLISEKAKKNLIETLQQRNEDYLDNVDVVKQLAEQIILERNLLKSKDVVIDANDIVCISGTTANKRKSKIGFTADIR